MKKNNLDEMQEQKMLKIEHNGFWIAFWGLVVVMILQALAGGYLDHIMGEAVVLGIVSIYLLVDCLKNGIWDRHLKPNWKTNLLCSLATGLFMGIFNWFRFGRHASTLTGQLMPSLISGIFVFLLTLSLLALCSYLYKKRRSTLDAE